MPRKKRIARRTKRVARRRVRARRRSNQASTTVHHRSLLAILIFLHVLKLIDEKTFNRVKNALYAPRVARRRRRRRSRRTR